jgi:putative peptidoglycan lipid II flippase
VLSNLLFCSSIDKVTKYQYTTLIFSHSRSQRGRAVDKSEKTVARLVHRPGKEEIPAISHESDRSQDTSATAITTATSAHPIAEERNAIVADTTPVKKRNRLFSGVYRLQLNNFLPGRSAFTLRRFSITEAALLLIAAYCASRGLGVIRQVIFNALFGAGPEANAYYAAAQLPNTLFDLIAGGALTHAFIPVFLSEEKNYGQREAWRLACLVFNILLVVLTLFVLLAEFLAPVFVTRLLVPGYSPAEQALVTSLTRIILFQPLILGLGTVATAILNSKRQFLLPALSLALFDVGIIAGLLVALAVPGVGIYGPTCGIVASAIIQTSVMIPGLVKQGFRYSFAWDVRYPGFRDILRLLIPNVIAVIIGSTGSIAQTAFISYMQDRASLSAVHNANLLFAFPQTLVSQAVGQAALPMMAALVVAGHYERYRQTLVKLLSWACVASIAASVFLFVFGKPLIHLFFQHGAYGKHAAALTGTALMGYAIALPGLALALLLGVSFYALQDARTPLFGDLLALLVRLALIVMLLKILTGSHLILAIPLAHAGGGIVETLLLGSLLFWRLRTKVKLDKGMLRLARWKQLNAEKRNVSSHLNQ